jgi:hypothetical protein
MHAPAALAMKWRTRRPPGADAVKRGEGAGAAGQGPRLGAGPPRSGIFHFAGVLHAHRRLPHCNALLAMVLIPRLCAAQ